MRKLFLITLALTATQALSKNTVPPSSPELITKGQAVYKANCAVCHGDTGDGNGPAGSALQPKARNFISEKFKFGSKPEQVFKLIATGSKNTSMASFQHLPEPDRWAVTYYVLSLKKK
ncbi:MAG: cytochrome c [Bdellovibrionales bacterium]|nr:cytochrome c [Bdellovibrionales bacterium]